MVTGAYDKAYQFISDNLDIIHRMANALLEKETLNSHDIDEIMAAGKEPIQDET